MSLSERPDDESHQSKGHRQVMVLPEPIRSDPSRGNPIRSDPIRFIRYNLLVKVCIQFCIQNCFNVLETGCMTLPPHPRGGCGGRCHVWDHMSRVTWCVILLESDEGSTVVMMGWRSQQQYSDKLQCLNNAQLAGRGQCPPTPLPDQQQPAATRHLPHYHAQA